MSTARKSKTDQGRIPVKRKINSIYPAPENETLYRPVADNDPEIIALAESIRVHGVKEPLVITLDSYILSGHRRHAAAKLAGLKKVPCRVENIRRTDDNFVETLREYNRQRVKTLDEVIREEVVSANPEDCYRELLTHRAERCQIDEPLGEITIEGFKHRPKISDAKGPFLDAIKRILDEHSSFWPFTVRQIHYQLLNDPPLIHANKPNSHYTNSTQSYKALIDLISRARLDFKISWSAIDDDTRPVDTWKPDKTVAPFLQEQLEQFLKGYRRDLQQSQPNHIEIVGEKNTIANIIRPVAEEYCIPLTIGRGYSSLPPRKQMEVRYHLSGKQQLILLVLSDFDPEGEDIVHSLARSMRDDFNIPNVRVIKVALTRTQIDQFQLHPQMTVKVSSSRCNGFIRRHGDEVFELEAIEPTALQKILSDAIDGILDIDAFNAEIEAEKQDSVKLNSIRRAVWAQMKQHRV